MTRKGGWRTYQSPDNPVPRFNLKRPYSLLTPYSRLEWSSKQEQTAELADEKVEGEEAIPELEQQKISQKPEIAGEKNSEEIVPVMELENGNK